MTSPLLSRWHRRMCRKNNAPAWTIEDSFESLLLKLSEAGLVDRTNPQVEKAVELAWIKMAEATYLPSKLRQEILAYIGIDPCQWQNSVLEEIYSPDFDAKKFRQTGWFQP